jgi:hypothetical protein
MQRFLDQPGPADDKLHMGMVARGPEQQIPHLKRIRNDRVGRLLGIDPPGGGPFET